MTDPDQKPPKKGMSDGCFILALIYALFLAWAIADILGYAIPMWLDESNQPGATNER